MLTPIDDSKSAKIMEDAVQFKLHVAGELLKAIPHDIPDANSGFKYLELEANCEGFLFFLCSAQDVLFREISEKILDKWFVSPMLHQLKDDLKRANHETHPLAHKVLHILKYYFPEPTLRSKRITHEQWETLSRSTESDMNSLFEISNGVKTTFSRTPLPEYFIEGTEADGLYKIYWDLEKSLLTIIRQIRNDITHYLPQMHMGYSSIINLDGTQMKNTFVFRTKKRQVRSASEIRANILEFFYLEFEENNPHSLFENALKKTIEFVKTTRSVIPN